MLLNSSKNIGISDSPREVAILGSHSWFSSKIFKYGDEYYTDFDFYGVKKSISGPEKWVSKSGSNSNDGNSPFTPYATVQYAYAQGGRRIHLKSGDVFLYNQGFQTTRPTQDTSIDTYGGTEPSVLSTALQMSFSPDGTHLNTYSSTSSEPSRSIVIVFDATKKDNNSSFIPYLRLSSAAEVNATLGSFYYDSATDTLWVRTWDDRAPDADLFCCLDNLAAIPLNNANDTSSIYCENIYFIGGTPCNVRSNLGRTVSFNFCRSTGYNSNGSFFIENNVTATFYYCRADYGRNDGFNYQNTCKAFEWHCGSQYNGQYEGTDSNNGSTGHSSSKVISVGSCHIRSRGKLIQHIQDAKAWYIDCDCGHSLSAEGDDDTAAFATSSVSPNNTELVLYECRSLGRATDLSYWAFPGSTLKIYDGKKGNVNRTPNRIDAGSIVLIVDESEVFL